MPASADREIDPGTEAQPITWSCLHYCILMVLIPLLAVPACIALGASDFFLRHGASVWVRSNDSVFDMHGRQCDVLIYGDSTAMTGIDPDAVESQTGFRTCNIAVTNAVLAVTGNLTLDHFLGRNGKPRVILVQLSPDGFQPEDHAWRQTIYAEGLLELLRHGSPADVRHILLHHPAESVSFAGYAAGFSAWYAIKDAWFHTTHMRTEEDSVTVRNGFFTPPSPPKTSCAPAIPVLQPRSPSRTQFSRELVAGYRNGYSSRAGLVLVNVAPIPACDQNLAAYQSELEGVTSNALAPLPIGYFNDGRHYTAPGAQILSTAIAREINYVANHNLAVDPTPSGNLTSLRNVRYP